MRFLGRDHDCYEIIIRLKNRSKIDMLSIFIQVNDKYNHSGGKWVAPNPTTWTKNIHQSILLSWVWFVFLKLPKKIAYL